MYRMLLCERMLDMSEWVAMSTECSADKTPTRRYGVVVVSVSRHSSSAMPARTPPEWNWSNTTAASVRARETRLEQND